MEILQQALMYFGVGNWSRIVESGCLPGKTVAQLNNQTQRMLGQQSTAGPAVRWLQQRWRWCRLSVWRPEFADLHIDVLRVGTENSKRTGPEVVRKGGLIVNSGRTAASLHDGWMDGHVMIDG